MKKTSKKFESEETSKPPSFRETAYVYGIHASTPTRRNNKTSVQRTEAFASKQSLTPFEETSLRDIILQLEDWGFPPYVSRVKEIAQDLLKKGGKETVIASECDKSFIAKTTTSVPFEFP